MALKDTNVNVSFLRGAHANLPWNNAIEGAFYLTTDSNRLYVGKSDKSLADLNKYINIVETVDKIDMNTAEVGDFYYVKDSNLLVVCELNALNQKEFTLINQNTNNIIDTATGDFTITAANDVATVKYTYTVTDNKGESVSDESAFTITGGDNIVVTANGTNIEIDGAQYTLGLTTNPSSNGDVESVTLNLVNSLGGTANTITFNAGENISLVKDANGEITLSSSYKNTQVTAATTVLNSDGSISVNLVNNDGTLVTSTPSAPILYKVGNVDYKPGETLDVYTKAEIDNQLKGLNGMTYKGTVSAASPLPTTNVSSGDTYLVAEDNFEYVAGKEANTGDLLIATGTEGSNGYLTSITWTYVPSGDDAEHDTEYKFKIDTANNKVMLVTKDEAATVGSHSIAVENGGVLSVVSTGSGSDLTTTLSHNKIATIVPEEETTENVANISAISDVTVDAYGHITGYKVSTSKILKYNLEGATAVANNVATYTTKLVDSKGALISTVEHKLTSDSLVVEADSDMVSVELNWGSF